MQKLAGFATLVLISLSSTNCFAQNVIRDYIIDKPHQFAPMDPWKTGRVFRNHMGHGGLFYNCDGQEDKRWSPWIDWQCQSNCGNDPNNWRWDWRQQVDEVKQRIRWGKGCDVPHYDVPYLPADRFGSIVPASQSGESPNYQANHSNPVSLLKRRTADSSKAAESGQGILR